MKNDHLRILLVEPAYKNKYPPLGLMKLSSYHKLRGDHVRFVKGCSSENLALRWDRIYVSTLFTFHWDITIKTIEFYKNAVSNHKNIIIGGVLATLLGDEIEKETGVTVIRGLLDKQCIFDEDSTIIIDAITPDYSLVDKSEYTYGLKDSYVAYATRGCPNRCKFCAVHEIEPEFKPYMPLKKQIEAIEAIYGAKQNLVLLDNNVLASKYLERIIDEIIELGFYKGAKFRNRLRALDFNQGIDMRLIKKRNMKLLSKIAIKPLRLALDTITLKKKYERAVRIAQEYDILNLSTYILYNYLDTPEDFYERLRLNVLLNSELGTKIYGFPMKYIPLNAKDRSYIGPHWSRQLIRGVQCILLATRGLVTPKTEFFEAAFGHNSEEFRQIALMPERYIIYRNHHAANGAAEWKRNFKSLRPIERKEFLDILASKNIKTEISNIRHSKRINRLLDHYIKPKNE